MPCLQKQTGVVRNQLLDLSNLVSPEAAAVLEADRIKPELRFSFLTLHVDMRRLMVVCRIEEQPVWTGTKNRRQRFQCIRSMDGTKVDSRSRRSMKSMSGAKPDKVCAAEGFLGIYVLPNLSSTHFHPPWWAPRSGGVVDHADSVTSSLNRINNIQIISQK